ncbi:ABC transporter ATP-binding protein [Daejeonella oryzae]|uniref:ABC transporter ATP-binding protein n=1 Tax=Daejeonella oryzae TaxID=1122943 RepID=UPI000408340A|nr:ABC transporter ATP-binding protein [Daejeonella oryzae]
MDQPLEIETRQLSYWFGTQKVLDNVSLQVPKGCIYGFLGPNGAGKTTAIKILLNLLYSSSENVFVFGEELNHSRISILSRIGSLVEQPAIYPHLSGRENLINRCILLQTDRKRVNELLRLVDLDTQADKKAGNYSLGMKQRLGIALALLPDPQLLILDEPTNGLDPNGIMEIRQLLQKLSREEGKTVFVSSHLLAEVEKMATHVGIINHGKLLFQGSIAELQRANNSLISLQVNDTVSAANLLLRNGYQVDVEVDSICLPYSSHEEMGSINSLLISKGYTVYSLSQTRKNLEQLFMNITQN